MPLLDIIKRFNWVDIFVLILFIRIGYISMKCGFITEIFKLFGTILAIYLSLHYSAIISGFVQNRLPVKAINPEFIYFLSFSLLAFLGYIIFVLLREAFSNFIKMEAIPRLNKYGGLTLGVIRWVFLTGLIIFILTISGPSYFKNSVVKSYCGITGFNIAPATYSVLWNNIMSKFMVNEKFNNTVIEIKNGLNKE